MRFIKRLWNDGPMYFTIGVLLYFAFAAVNIQVNKVHVDNPFSSSTTTSETTAETSDTKAPAVDSGALQFQVQAFRLQKTDNGLQAKLTIQVKNTGSSTAQVKPGDLQLRTASGTTISAEDYGPATQGVSPDVSRILGVTFPVAAASAPYLLLYEGRTIYSGTPRS